MKRNTKRLLIVGGFVAGAATLIYFLARSKTNALPSQPTPSLPNTKRPPPPTDPVNLDTILNDVAASRNGPDYETVLTYGDWTIDRERQYNFSKLSVGAVVRIRMYPTQTGYGGPHYDYVARVVKVMPVGNFAIYNVQWAGSPPGGLDPNTAITLTSADIASVVR